MIPDETGIPSPASLGNRGRSSFLARIVACTKKGSNVLAVLEQTLVHAWLILPNMLAVLAAALVSCVAVSFFRGETTIFTTTYQLVIFVAAVLSPFLVLAGGIALVAWAHRKQEWAQRELGTLFTLLFFAIAYYYELLKIPQITIAS
jgi:hypothetical protein